MTNWFWKVFGWKECVSCGKLTKSDARLAVAHSEGTLYKPLCEDCLFGLQEAAQNIAKKNKKTVHNDDD